MAAGRWSFLENFGTLWLMDRTEHGRRLTAAMALKGLDRETVAEAAGVGPRTVTNWRAGKTTPDARQLLALRELLGPYDDRPAGDPVVEALHASPLTEDRQYDVIGYYKRRLREQEEAAARSAVTSLPTLAQAAPGRHNKVLEDAMPAQIAAYEGDAADDKPSEPDDEPQG